MANSFLLDLSIDGAVDFKSLYGSKSLILSVGSDCSSLCGL